MVKRRLISIFCLAAMISGPGCVLSGEKPVKDSAGSAELNESVHKSGPVIEFASLEHDFGVVHEGEKVGWYFKFTNTGDSDLIIRAANASCGCTVPEFSKEPLSPGKEGMIKVIFDTSGRTGKQSKTINIETNDTNSLIYLKVIAEVISK